MKGIYIRLVRGIGALLRRVGLLGPIERRAPGSLAATWFVSLFAIHDLDALERLDVPWWTFESADLVASHLVSHPNARVFEWGSGASTLWLAARSQSVHSVEHHGGWGEQLRARLPENVTLEVVAPSPSRAPAVGSAKPGHDHLDFSAYVAAIDAVPGTFDVIVIDGRAREACLVRAVQRLSPSGLIVFDNVDRRRYAQAIDSLGDRVEVAMTRGLTPALPYPTRTAILRVPSYAATS